MHEPFLFNAGTSLKIYVPCDSKWTWNLSSTFSIAASISLFNSDCCLFLPTCFSFFPSAICLYILNMIAKFYYLLSHVIVLKQWQWSLTPKYSCLLFPQRVFFFWSGTRGPIYCSNLAKQWRANDLKESDWELATAPNSRPLVSIHASCILELELMWLAAAAASLLLT